MNFHRDFPDVFFSCFLSRNVFQSAAGMQRLAWEKLKKVEVSGAQFLSVPEVELYCEPTNRDKNPKESRQRKAYNKGFVSKILCIT